MGGISQPLNGIGINQTWKDVGGSRTSGTTYTNSSPSPILVCVSGLSNASYVLDFTVNVNSVNVERVQALTNAQQTTATIPATFVVPPNGTYTVTFASGTISKWFELS